MDLIATIEKLETKLQQLRNWRSQLTQLKIGGPKLHNHDNWGPKVQLRKQFILANLNIELCIINSTKTIYLNINEH